MEIVLGFVFILLLLLSIVFNFVGTSYYFDSYFVKDRPATRPVKKLPTVALGVASYNEDPALVKKALVSLKTVDYPKSLLKFYLLDDSSTPAIVGELRRTCTELGVIFMHRTDRTHFKAGALNHFLDQMSEDYFGMFDADEELTHPAFLKDVLPYFEADPLLISVQTVKRTRVGSLFSMAVDETYAFFLRFIQPIRSRDQMAMYQGSMGLLRSSLVRDAGGFPHSLTEDTALSFEADLKGFHGIYVPKQYAVGKPIERFSEFLVQQNRYSYGNASLINPYLKNWNRFSSRKRMHYFTQVFGLQYISAVYVFFALLTVLFALMGISRLIFSGEAFWQFAPQIQFSDLLPMLLTLISMYMVATFFFTSFRRGVIGYFLNFSVALVRMRAIFNAMLNRKALFVVVKKTDSFQRSLKKAVRLTLRETSFAMALLLFAFSSFIHADVISGLWLSYYSLLFFSAPLFAYVQG